METSPTASEIKANALRHARNTWRRYGTFVRRYREKFTTVSPPAPPHVFFNNRIHEDTYLKEDMKNGKLIEPRQKLADPIMVFRSKLEDPSEFDKIYAESLSRRMPGYTVEVSKAMSASQHNHEKDSIRTFVSKVK